MTSYQQNHNQTQWYPCSGAECEQTTDNAHHEYLLGTEVEKDVDKKMVENDKTTNTNTNAENLEPESDAPIRSPSASNITMKIQDSSDNFQGGTQNMHTCGILIVMAFVFILITWWHFLWMKIVKIFKTIRYYKDVMN